LDLIGAPAELLFREKVPAAMEVPYSMELVLPVALFKAI